MVNHTSILKEMGIKAFEIVGRLTGLLFCHKLTFNLVEKVFIFRLVAYWSYFCFKVFALKWKLRYKLVIGWSELKFLVK